MLIDSLAFTLEKSGCLKDFWGKLDEGADAALGVAASARPFMVSARFSMHPQTTLVVVAGEEAALSFYRGVVAYVGEDRAMLFPGREDHAFLQKKANMRQIGQRSACMNALATGKPVVVVASARSLLRALPPIEDGVWRPICLRSACELSDMDICVASTEEPVDDLPGLIAALEGMGYENTGELDGPGTFAIHGGTVDVFPGNSAFPVRLDFFGDELEEIRRIVPSTGQTIASLPHVEVYPTRELGATKIRIAKAKKTLAKAARSNPALRDMAEKLEGGLRFDGVDALLPYLHDKVVSLGSYLPDNALTVLVEPRSLFDDAQHAYDELESKARGTNIALEGLYLKPSQLDFGANQRATFMSIMQAGAQLDAELPVKRTEVAGHPDKLFGRLRSLIDADFTVVFSVPNHRARQDMRLALVEHSLPIQEWSDADFAQSEKEETQGAAKRRLRRGVVNVVDVDVPLGMIIPKAKLGIVSISDTQGASASRPSRHIDMTEITFPYKPGDYVVHAAHGVALFKDLVQREVDGTVRDYLHLEYSEGDKLFVPVEQLDRVTRYVGPEGASPRLTRLNTSDWSRALSKARKATKKLAFDLVDVYTRRASVQGYRFSCDTPWQVEMEEAFPYRETPDQLAAISDVKTDMESPKPMDRLVCGDVGFGKTEVALRAAFKATQDRKQVMVLCPTTILAQQHYSSFRDRFEPFGVKVEVLSRFRTPQQQAHALQGFAEGGVDVLVGTHRLLSRDVNPHDLGLVIIDEEQRFGVGHKEQLKNLRESVDVLTLSATPIPRTMQMSLSGVRDMSLILTPPDDRRPVEVHVGEWDPDIVSAAIRREIERGGTGVLRVEQGSLDR